MIAPKKTVPTDCDSLSHLSQKSNMGSYLSVADEFTTQNARTTDSRCATLASGLSRPLHHNTSANSDPVAIHQGSLNQECISKSIYLLLLNYPRCLQPRVMKSDS